MDIVYADSFSTPTDAHHRRSDDPAAIAAFRHSLDLVAALPCDILLTPHPLRSNLPSRLDGKAPMAQREVAALLGISRSYVSRIEKKAVGILRGCFADEIPHGL